MSLGGILEFSIHFDLFRNVDLFHQGIYVVRTSLYEQSTLHCASPYNLRSLDKTKLGSAHYLSPPVLSTYSASSKAFLVRYCEEEVDLKETINFRLDSPVPVDLAAKELLLEFELLFSDLGGSLTPEEAVVRLAEQGPLGPVSKVQFILQFPYRPVHSFLPITFDEAHSCVVYAHIHYLLCKYQVLPDHSLFSSKTGKTKGYVGAAETDQVYTQFMNQLTRTYDKLRSHYLLLLGKCFTPAERMKLSLKYIPPCLDAPGEPVRSMSINFKRVSYPLQSVSEASDTDLDDDIHLLSRFSERVASHDPSKITSAMLEEFNMVSRQIHSLWDKLLELLPEIPRILSILLFENYKKSLKSKLERNRTLKIEYSTDLNVFCGTHSEVLEESTRTVRSSRARGARRSCVSDARLLPESLSQPVFLEEFSQKAPNEHNPASDYSGMHLFVLVHGFQGSSNDMRVLKNNISILYPDSLFLLSSANEDNTECAIQLMGMKLAQEVVDFICEWCPHNSLERLSFIGHSLGGLIIRAALAHLESYSMKMHLYMSLSTPHLGIIKGTSGLVRAGIWLLKALKKTPSLSEISMGDHVLMEDCYLYFLSQKSGLEWFRHMVLVSSPQDLYAPSYSAKVQVPSMRDSVRGAVVRKMAENLLMRRENVCRISVDFKIEENSIDCWIGRAAHIQFLESQLFMRTLVYLHPEFFE